MVQPSYILSLLRPNFSTLAVHLSDDREFQAAASVCLKTGNNAPVKFGIASSDTPGANDDWVLLTVKAGLSPNPQPQIVLSPGSQSSALFFLQARPSDWKSFFSPPSELVRPYQSFWGMLRILGPSGDVCIVGDVKGFGKLARLWRIVLDGIRDVICGRLALTGDTGPKVQVPSHASVNTATTLTSASAAADNDDDNDDNAAEIIGRYISVTHSTYGSLRLFYETSGNGSQMILFLHTAGSDSRQYHSLMLLPSLQKSCTMYAFDLPAHGRSSLGSKMIPENYALTEEDYLESIQLVITRLKLSRNDNLILCGASMAGHICLAAALRAREMGVRGVIPCEAAAHLPLSQPIYEISGSDAAVLDPERVCGMIAPMSPEENKRQIWWQYSSQGTGIFAGDLKFYFRGWDGRDRLQRGGVDIDYCPVYMLTGEYDYSCTVEMSKETARLIEGAEFEPMKGLGHFPLTENPAVVLIYLERAIGAIQKKRQNGTRE